MNASGNSDRKLKDKNQNIQVFVRLRPLNARERDLKSIGVIEVSGNKEVVVRQPVLDSKLTKKFVFDRAFGPYSKQVDVYNEVVNPLIEEVLAGYNCTVFAYGQTGTGKTHTMVGQSSSDGDVPWQNDPMAGIVPRSLSQLFDELRLTNSEYTVRVSYLELYNEELFDLLSTSEDNSKLRIYEDVTRKGSNIVNGLEEMTVYNKNEVYKIMSKGQEKRRTASTLMNAQSSRSHTVFTITVHMKENSADGEELMKIGKLNLVDLAGSENISKAGTDNPSRKERARECVNINQSLLTLGRVITALVERHPHIPYRESKLTRLLQESLGGRTKTSIIATISPGHRDIEETLSTLEYAHRARNIQNKPEINQKLTKVAVLKEYSEEIDRLKRDLYASREKNGVYLAPESYTSMTLKIEEQEKEIQDKILYIKALKDEKDRFETLFNEMSLNLKETEDKLIVTNQKLDVTKHHLINKKKELWHTQNEVEEQKHLVSVQVETEKKLSNQAGHLVNVADTTTTDVQFLQNTLEKKKALEDKNYDVTKSFGAKSLTQRNYIKEHINNYIDSNYESFSSFNETLDGYLADYTMNQTTTKEIILDMFKTIGETMSMSNNTKNDLIKKSSDNTTTQLEAFRKEIEIQHQNMSQKFIDMFTLLNKLNEARSQDQKTVENMKHFVGKWQISSNAKIKSLQTMNSDLWNETNTYMKNISEQHNTVEEYNINQLKKTMELRKQQDNEFDTDLKNIKTMISVLEEKHSSNRIALSDLDENHLVYCKESSKSFNDMLQNGNNAINTKGQQIECMVKCLDDTSKTFVRDINAKLDHYEQKIEVDKSLDQNIQESLVSVENYMKNALNTDCDNIFIIKDNINQTYSNALTFQHQTFSDFFGECCAKHETILQPINSTIESTNKQRVYQIEQYGKVKHSKDTFKENLNEALTMYDNMELRFLNEEYKLYSPTGKTPTRKEYMYPRDLAATSPHERILMRFRKTLLENRKNKSLNDSSASLPEYRPIISLDNTMEITPIRHIENYQSDHENMSQNSCLIVDDSALFIQPKPMSNLSTPNMIYKSSSENDILNLNNSKENINNISNEKKSSLSKLRPPSAKKVLTSKNY